MIIIVKLFDLFILYNFFLECVTPKDCPNGGFNYECEKNLCKCPSPMVLDGQICKGMLLLTKKIDFQYLISCATKYKDLCICYH